MRKIRFKWLAGALAAMLIIAALAGCGGAQALQRPMPSPSAALLPVTGTCSISKDGDVITVSGTTDIMNGAWIDISVVAQNSVVIDHRTIAKTSDEISEQFTVPADKLAGVVDMKGYITCAPSYYGKQPAEVYGAYGNKFEKVTTNVAPGQNNDVWSNEGVILAFASDWLYGVVPEMTPSPAAAPAATPTVSAQAAATPSA